MRVLIYEWVSGGGMLGWPGSLPPGLLREGQAMAQAAGAEFAKLAGARVTLLRDVRVMDLSAAGCEVLGVDSAAMRDDLLYQRFRDSDAVLLIAPELDGCLLRVARDAEAAGAKLISPDSAFIAITADKCQTAARLAEAGVPVPPGVRLEEDDPLPAEFAYPAVIKPVDGAGSEDTYLVAGPHDAPPPYAWPRRLERYCPGQPVSVAVLCGAAKPSALPPCRQHLSDDGRLRYLGGSGPLPAALAGRAQHLAIGALAALPATVGYVGVDLVLGADPRGYDDYVIEINPRLTTSFTALRFAARTSLAGAIVACQQGHTPDVEFDDRAYRFTPDGIVTLD